MSNISNFIVKPIISEKSFEEAKSNKYTFIVDSFATKTDIKHAIQKLFNVKVKKVFTANIKGSRTKSTRYGKRSFDASYKKARVLVSEGQKIDIFEEKTKEEKKK